MTSTGLIGTTSIAFGAGVATFFSPCAYALLPGYVGYYVQSADTQGDAPLFGALLRGLAALVGVGMVFATLSVAIVLVGRSLQPVLAIIEPLVGVALVILGAIVLGGWRPRWHAVLPARRSSVLGFAVFGGGYAIAAAGCTAPFFIAIMLRAAMLPPGEAMVVVGAFAGGFGALLLGATVAIAVGRDAVVGWLGRRRAWLDAAAGIALVLAGLGQVYVSL